MEKHSEKANPERVERKSMTFNPSGVVDLTAHSPRVSLVAIHVQALRAFSMLDSAQNDIQL